MVARAAAGTDDPAQVVAGAGRDRASYLPAMVERPRQPVTAVSVSIHSLGGAFAGEVSGLDITNPIGAVDVAAIEAGMDAYAVLVFRDQPLTDEQQIAFTLNFGELENYKSPGHIRKREDHRLGPGIADFSNLDRQGKIMSAEDRVWFFKLGDRLWHSDSSFRPAPAKYSLLSGRIIPSWGANTEFADMRGAYDALDARTKAEIAGLICEHSLIYSREAIGFVDLTPKKSRPSPGAPPPVRRHRSPAVPRSFSRPTPEQSSAGPFPRRGCSCVI
jgi:hypothetical protein